MSDPRPTPFTTNAAPEPAPISVPPTRPDNLDPSDAPMRILLNWVVLIGGLGLTLWIGGMVV